MVVQLVLQFVFQEDKLETTPVTVKGLIDLKQTDGPAVTEGRSPGLDPPPSSTAGYLVSQQVLLVAHRVPGHLQAEDTQQEAGVRVDAGKVSKDVQVEGGAKQTHLQITPASEGQFPRWARGSRTRGGWGTLTWQTYGISPGLWLDFM